MPAAAAVVFVVLGAGWFWLLRPATTKAGQAAGAAQGTVLRVTSGNSMVNLRAGAKQAATMRLPGVPGVTAASGP